MSFEVYALVKKRVIGSSTKKSVALYLSDLASDNGSGIWAAKGNIAKDLELSKRAVQISINDLVRDGLLEFVRERPHHAGFTMEYRLRLDAIADLPETRNHGWNRVNVIHPPHADSSPEGVNLVHGEG